MINLKRTLFFSLGLVYLLALGASPAGAMGHYPPGVEGVKAASVPPPGFYFRTYGIFLNSDKMRDDNGDEMKIDFELKSFAWINRFIYITDFKILGANLGLHLLIPSTDTNVEIKAAGVDDSHVGVGDIIVEPFLLSWHGARYDAALGLSAILPTGDYDSNKAASPGLGYWSGLLSFGGTYYFDKARTWSASILNRLLWNSAQEDTGITPGKEWVAEWGVGKDLMVSSSLMVTPGIRGCIYMQLTEDDGPGATDHLSRKYGIGPEINFFWFPKKLQINFAYVKDFGVKNEAEIQQFLLTLTKSF